MRATAILALAWAMLFAASFLAFALVPASDMGFLRGLNRLFAWFLLQLGALAVALAGWALARRLPRPLPGLDQWLVHGPLAISAAVAGIPILMVLALMFAPGLLR